MTTKTYDPLNPQRFGAMHVLDSGFDQHKGVGWGVVNGCLPIPEDNGDPHRGDYEDYCIFVNGESEDAPGDHITTYNTINTTNNAITFISDSVAAGDPFFAYVPYQAPHSPFHTPPPALCPITYDAAFAEPDNKVLQVRAMVEAVDTEIRRLLDSIAEFPLNETTYVFLIGDNGTATSATRAPFLPSHGKGSVFEGGINVPFIVTGPDVVPGESQGLISVVDLFATIADLSGTPHDNADKPHSISLKPYLDDPGIDSLRDCIFVEAFHPNYSPDGPIPLDYDRYEQAIRNDEYKLIRRLTSGGETEHLYHLGPYPPVPADDPFEETDLLLDVLDDDAQLAYDKLKKFLPAFPRGGQIRI